MPERERPLSPHLQIYKFQYTMVLSITHRLTGVLLSVGSVLFVYWLMAIALGSQPYAGARELLSTPVARIAWAGLIACFCYHLANGIRHLVWDCGFGLEKRQARASGWAVVVATLVLSAVGIAYAFDLVGGRA
jgi:succinate dehydrogenase / fumarate reductase, cytochrome b subunit